VNFGFVTKTTEKHWQQRQGMTVRFERNENIDRSPGSGESTT